MFNIFGWNSFHSKMQLLSACLEADGDKLEKLLSVNPSLANAMIGGEARPLHSLILGDESDDSRLAYCADIILYYGADPDGRNNRRVTPLMLAVSFELPHLAQLLIDAKADLAALDRKKDHALIWAASTNRVSSLSMLIEYGSEVNHRGGYKRTALMYACRNGNKTFVEELIMADANPNYVDLSGGTAVQLAAERGYRGIVESLIKADINVYKQISFFGAASIGFVDIVREKISQGANLLEENSNEFTAIELSIVYKQKEVLDILAPLIHDQLYFDKVLSLSCLSKYEYGLELALSHGANVNYQDEKKDTALIHAVNNGYISAVKCLLNANANIDLVNANGETALSLAQKKREWDILQLLYAYI